MYENEKIVMFVYTSRWDTLHKPQRASSVSFSAFFFAYKIYVGYVNAYIWNIDYICICEDEIMHVMYYHVKKNVEIKTNQSINQSSMWNVAPPNS